MTDELILTTVYHSIRKLPCIDQSVIHSLVGIYSRQREKEC